MSSRGLTAGSRTHGRIQTQHRHQSRTRDLRHMNDLLQHMGFAWRSTLKRPATSLLIVFTLALGIGANSAMFSMAWHVLGAPLPYADGDRLVLLEQHDTGNGRENIPWSLPTLDDLRAGAAVFTDVVGYFQTEYPLYGNGDPHLA